MEKVSENSMVIRNNPKEIIPVDHKHDQTTQLQHDSSQKKGKRSKNIFKVALYMMRGRSRKPKKLPVDDESKSVWRKVVGSMRPLHLQSNQSPSHNNDNNNPQLPMKITSSLHENGMDHGDDGFDSASEFAYSLSPSSSRYASAVGLNELVQEEEKEEEEEEETVKELNDNDGDEMIDAKAEEFIAQFYHQMRLQSLDTTEDHYQELNMRSSGL